jgi:hypothetical protein
MAGRSLQYIITRADIRAAVGVSEASTKRWLAGVPRQRVNGDIVTDGQGAYTVADTVVALRKNKCRKLSRGPLRRLLGLAPPFDPSQPLGKYAVASGRALRAVLTRDERDRAKKIEDAFAAACLQAFWAGVVHIQSGDMANSFITTPPALGYILCNDTAIFAEDAVDFAAKFVIANSPSGVIAKLAATPSEIKQLADNRRNKLSEQYTISRANILHVLTAERGTKVEDRRHIDAALKAALAQFKGQGVRYTLDNAIWACANAGYPPTVEEVEALQRIDAEVSEVANV